MIDDAGGLRAPVDIVPQHHDELSPLNARAVPGDLVLEDQQFGQAAMDVAYGVDDGRSRVDPKMLVGGRGGGR
ncbi:hypothetical protein D3C87_1939060 [compost metagenome]